jgi:hypothetical protein
MLPISYFLHYNPPCIFLSLGFFTELSSNTFIGLHYKQPNPSPSLYPAYIYVHIPFTSYFNPKDGGSTVL